MEKDSIIRSGTAPAGPKENDLWVDTAARRLKLWDGKEWVVIGYEPPDPEPEPEPEPEPDPDPSEAGGDDGEDSRNEEAGTEPEKGGG